MPLLLVRHAWAGTREAWAGDDRERPLDERGRRQADELVARLATFPVDRVVSSPAVRCLQTVAPLAAARGLVVEPRVELGEERQHVDGAAFLRELAGLDVVVCGHGGLEASVSGAPRWKKGATFVVGAGLDLVETLPPRP